MATSFLFNSTNGLDTYRNDDIIQGLLNNNFVLLNLEEFLDWYEPDESRQNPHRAAAAQNPFAPTTIRRQASYDEKLVKARNILPKLASLCRGIGLVYGQQAVTNLLDKNASFDLLVALQADYESVNRIGRTETVSQRKLEKVVAFIIVELGECIKKPNTISVNLICGKSSIPQFKASILLGAYLYCIKKTRYDQEGILELAGGYTNPSGFMSYTKLGFNYDKTLYGVNCFDAFENLPMSVNLVKMSPETIINLFGDVFKKDLINDYMIITNMINNYHLDNIKNVDMVWDKLSYVDKLKNNNYIEWKKLLIHCVITSNCVKMNHVDLIQTIDLIREKYLLNNTDWIDLIFNIMDVIYANDFKKNLVTKMFSCEMFWSNVIVRSNNVYALPLFSLRKMLNRYNGLHVDLVIEGQVLHLETTVNKNIFTLELEKYLYNILKSTYPGDFSTFDDILI